MPGIRIRPQPDRRTPDNAIVVVVDNSRPIPAPKNGKPLHEVKAVCGTCGVLHRFKTYHFQLRAGSVIVSPVIWGYLTAMVDDGGFEFMNTVSDPPAQQLNIGPDGMGEVILLEKYVTPIGG